MGILFEIALAMVTIPLRFAYRVGKAVWSDVSSMRERSRMRRAREQPMPEGPYRSSLSAAHQQPSYLALDAGIDVRFCLDPFCRRPDRQYR